MSSVQVKIGNYNYTRAMSNCARSLLEQINSKHKSAGT